MAENLTPDTENAGTINIIERTGPLAQGPVVTVSGTFDNNNDVDWFAITMEAGKGYSFDLRTGDSSSGDQDPKIVGIYGPGSDGNYDNSFNSGTGDDDGGTGSSARVHFAAPTAGTYYIAVGLNSANTNLPYTLRVREDDYSQQFPGRAGTIEVGGSARGTIEVKYDEDWFEVDLEGGEGYTVRVLSTGNSPVPSPVIYGVWDTTGGRPSIISGTNGKGENRNQASVIDFVAPSDGTYYVRVRALDTGDSRGTYELRIAEHEDDHDDSPLGPGVLPVTGSGSTASGTINYKGDIDWFMVTLEAGRTYQFEANGQGNTNMVIEGLYVPTYLGNHYIGRTYDDDGGTGNNALLTYIPTASGTYYLAVSSKSDDSSHTYTVKAPDITPKGPYWPGPRPNNPADDYGERDQDAGALTVGTSGNSMPVMGNIEFRHDRDWFKVMLTGGTSYEINLKGAKTGDGTLYDPFLRGIYDSSGLLLRGTVNDDGGTSLNSRVTLNLEADEGGVYYISAAGWGAATGTYELSIDAM